jgi:hypothetical protein
MNARGLTPLGRIAHEAIAASVARQVDLNRIGWSAPNSPADSIDDVEFDLASFRAASVAKVRGGFAWIGAVSRRTE